MYWYKFVHNFIYIPVSTRKGGKNGDYKQNVSRDKEITEDRTIVIKGTRILYVCSCFKHFELNVRLDQIQILLKSISSQMKMPEFKVVVILVQ